MGVLLSWLRRHNAIIILALSVAILVALLYGGARRDLVDLQRLKDSKDALAAANSLVNIAAVLLAFALAYFRFFAGRTFARRAGLELSVEMASPKDGPALHAVTLKVANIGTLTIHDPQLSVEVVDYSGDGLEERGTIESWVSNDAFKSESLEAVIDPGETAHFHAVRRLAPGRWASSYAAVVRDRQGNVWQCFALATGAPPAEAEPEPPVPAAAAEAEGWLARTAGALRSLFRAKD